MGDKIFFVLYLISLINSVAWGQAQQLAFTIPALTLYAYQPRGFRAEMPDDNGIKLFTFHGKVNGLLSTAVDTDLSGDINSPTNGKWVYENPYLALAVGDKIDYWIYVQHNSFGYTKHNVVFEVRELTCKCNSSTITSTKIYTKMCCGSIIFTDEFEEFEVDTNKWIPQQYIPSYTDDDHYEFVSYQTDSIHLFTRESRLYLKPTVARSYYEVTGRLNLTEGCTRSNRYSCDYTQVGSFILPPVTSAKIVSKLSFKYGKIEIKAKLPIGDWIYPQIELIPVNKLPQYPKIIIAYSRGNLNLSLNSGDDLGNTLLFGGPVSTEVEPERSRNLKSRRLTVPFGREMRTYGLLWSPSRIDISVDNTVYGTILANEYTELNSEYQIALGVGVGGNYDFPDETKSSSYLKPWSNFDLKTMNNFFKTRGSWNTSWFGDDVALQIDSVKVSAL